jgi:hypothetical protein
MHLFRFLWQLDALHEIVPLHGEALGVIVLAAGLGEQLRPYNLLPGQRSVELRLFGARATDGTASIRGAHPGGTLSNLRAFDLECPLPRVRVEEQNPSDRAIVEGWPVNQRCLLLRCPSFDTFGHRQTQCYFSPYSMLRFLLGRS